MRALLAIVAMAMIGAMGCAADEEGDDLPGGGSLNGTWTLPSETWLGDLPYEEDYDGPAEFSSPPLCNLALSGSTGTANCETTATFKDKGSKAIYTFSLAATASIAETSISAQGTYRIQGRFEYDQQPDTFDCTLTFSGSASRREGRQTTGRFAALAGVWEGALNTSSKCERSWDRDEDESSKSWRFDADLFAEQGTVAVRELGDDDAVTWVLQNTATGVLVAPFGSDDQLTATEVQ